jgi:hypothetical protein
LSSRPATKNGLREAVARPRMRRQVEVRKVRPELVSRYSCVCVA